MLVSPSRGARSGVLQGGERVNFFATAAKGTEGALRDELRGIGVRRVRADRGGVHFEGELRDGYLVCLRSRIAMRVLLTVGGGEVRDERELYAVVRSVDWSSVLTAKKTLAVSAHCRSSGLTHTQFVAQRTKDAIVDQLRDRFGARPSVDRDDPDVHVYVHIVKDHATVYLDLAGEPLHRRGYRARIGDAPLKETLAAAMLRVAGWDAASPLCDPMCGSGTIVIEAAMMAADADPGLARKRFGFERWASFGAGEAAAIRALREEGRARRKKAAVPLYGFDTDVRVLDLARENARVAGVDVVFERRDLRDFVPPAEPITIVTNPPYGERLEAERALFELLAKKMRPLRGSTVAILAGGPEVEASFRRKPDRWLALWNGPIETRLLVYV